MLKCICMHDSTGFSGRLELAFMPGILLKELTRKGIAISTSLEGIL